MTHQLDMQQIEQQANELLNVRLESVRALARTRAALEQHRNTLREAEAEDAQRLEEAIAAGWSDRELRTLGLAAAAAKPKTRAPRGSRTRSAKPSDNLNDAAPTSTPGASTESRSPDEMR